MPSFTEKELNELTLLNNISVDTQTALLKTGTLHTYKAGTHVFHEKDVLGCLYIILSGTVCLYKMNANGHDKSIFIFGKDHLLNESLFEPTSSAINCKVIQDATILSWPLSDIAPLLQRDFTFLQNLVNHLSKRVRRLYRQLKNATSVIKIEKKLAAKLWKLSQDYGVPHPDGVKIDFPITITALSDLMGSYRETISRAIKYLSTQNLIIYKDKYIIIPNPQDLSNYFKTP